MACNHDKQISAVRYSPRSLCKRRLSYSALKVEAVRLSETLVSNYMSTQRYNPEQQYQHQSRDNVIYHTFSVVIYSLI
jgi:hypothetical protein